MVQSEKKKLEIALLISAIPVFADTAADPATKSIVPTVSEDIQVHEAYEAYLGIVDALGTNDYDSLEDCYKEYISIVVNFTDEQDEEWNSIVEEKIGVDEALSNLYDAACVVNTIGLMEEYEKNPNAKTAYDFVKAYDTCLDFEISINSMHDGVESAYKTAKSKDMPSDNAVAVAEAYKDVVKALESGDATKLDDAIEGFYKVMDIYNNLELDEFEDIACLLELKSEDPELTDGEYITQVIFADWMNINVLDSIDKVYSEYLDNPNAENAEALVEFYELVFPENEDDGAISEDLVYAFFPDLDDVYNEAKALLEAGKDSDSNKNDDKDTNKDTNKDADNAANAPQTGDDFNMQLPLIAMLVSAAAVGLAIRRKVQ